MARTTYSGTCALCGAALDSRTAAAHLNTCAPGHDPSSGASRPLVRLRVTGLGAKAYWLDVEARADASLVTLDRFLRDIWLECCGHMSLFSIPPYEYSSSPTGSMGLAGRAHNERSMKAAISEAFARARAKATYDYDFGSTTRLALEVTGTRHGRLGKPGVRLLARNNPLPWKCGLCRQPAVSVCTQHAERTSPFVCAVHEKTHRSEDAAFLPVVNSPRMGVCAYAG